MPSRFPSRPTLLALCCCLSFGAHAADAAIDLGPVDVTADAVKKTAQTPIPEYSGGQVARGGQMGVLGNQDIMDVPFTMTSYTAKLMQDQQAEDVGDVLLNDSSVRTSYGYGNQSQIFVIRGLPLNSDDISYGGLYGVLPRQIIGIEAIDRVEVFKGPSAFVNGVTPSGSGLGGTVNLQPKYATDTPIRRYTQDISSDGRIGEHLDIGQRFGEDNRFGARVNLMQREGDTAVDDQSQRSKLFVAGLDYRGDDLRLSTTFGYQKQRVNGLRNDVYLGSVTSIPTAPSARTNYGTDWSYEETEDTFGMVRGDWDLNDSWSAYLAGGAKHDRETGVYATPTLADASTGAATISGSKIPSNIDSTSFMGGLNGNFTTGPVSHQVNIGASTLWTQQESAYEFYNGTSTATNIYSPTAVSKGTYSYLTGGDMGDPGVTSKTRARSIAASDTLGFLDDSVLLTLGLRRQQLRVEGYNYDGSTYNGVSTGADGTRSSLYDEGITTPVFGIVYKPVDHVSVYANRIEGLATGGTAPLTANNRGQTYAPGRTKQVEAGVKLDMGTYGASVAAYRIDKPNEGYTDADNNFVRSGNQINRGVELNLFGEPVPGLRVLAGATRMTSKLEDVATASNDGNHAIGVPTFQLNASVDWDVPGLDGVALNARMLRTGGQYADEANTLSLPTWNRFDAGARYAFKVDQKAVTLRLNVDNLTNKNYWASANGGYLTQGEPRLVKLSGSIDF
jgi:iron complex outermembrane receptor protein